MTNHPARPGRPARHVYPAQRAFTDYGGWISGPCAGYQCDACRQDVHCFGSRCSCCHREPEMPPAGPVRADGIRRGDVLAYDGRLLTVTAVTSTWYVDTSGEHVSGLAVCTEDGSARWTLYRRSSDLVMRVTS
jgi:hypothetical protein